MKGRKGLTKWVVIQSFFMILAAGLMLMPSLIQAAAKPAELKIAVIHSMSGAGAPHDLPAINAAKLLFEKINAAGGISGVKLKGIYVDEAGSTDDKVAEFRRLVQDEKVDVVMGYTSSAKSLAVAPLAEELKTLTIFHVTANYRLFEERKYKYVFRTVAHCVSENVSAALYVLDMKPDLKTIAGLNYDYAYGRDSWEVFKKTILKMKPDVKVVGELWTKFLATEYSAEVSKLLALKPDAIHTVNWGAGLNALIKVADIRGLFKQSLMVVTTGLLEQAELLPPGVAFSGRGYHLQHPDPDQYRPNKEFIESYKAKFGASPDYTGHFMAQAVYALKAGIEKAVSAKGGKWPNTDEIIDALRNLTYDTPRGPVHIRGGDHQAVHEAIWGLTSGKKHPKYGFPLLDKLKVYPAERVNNPLGTKAIEWIESWPEKK